MHIPDGLLPPSVCISSYALTGAISWFSLQQIKRESIPQEQIPKASLLTAAFFIASLIHIPVPPFSIHLVLNGLMGIVLGYYSFLAILVGLFFQAVFFHHGGLSTLGVNVVIMGTPALFAHHFWLWRKLPSFQNPIWHGVFAFIAGGMSLFLSALLFVLITINNISPDLDLMVEKAAILTSLIGYGIQGAIEGTITVMLVSFLERVKPELLENL